MLDKFKLVGISIITVLILGVAGTIYFKVTSKISGLEETLGNKEKLIQDLTNDKNTLSAKLIMEKANSDKLSKELERILQEATVMDNRINLAKKELEEWKAKPAEIKYVDKVREIMVPSSNSKDCNYGLELNKQISNLKYKEL